MVQLMPLHPRTPSSLKSRLVLPFWYRLTQVVLKKKSLDLNEARDDGVLGRQWHQLDICKQSAPRYSQITTPTPHKLNFYRPDAVPDTQPTVSKH